jgi:hypothetical protein
MNYARRSLLPDEHVLSYVLQPEIRRSAYSFLGRPLLPSVLGPAHLCVLTDRELILIRDDLESLKGCDEGRYGGVWNFVPLERLVSVEVQTDAYGNLRLVFTMHSGDRLESLFAGEQRDELSRLVSAVGSMTAEVLA